MRISNSDVIFTALFKFSWFFREGDRDADGEDGQSRGHENGSTSTLSVREKR